MSHADSAADVRVARLSGADVAAYRELMLEAYALYPSAFTSTVAERAALPLAWWHARIGDGAPDPDELVIGAFAGTELAGMAGLSFEKREKTRHKATLFGMYVPERRCGQGIGRRLVDAVLVQARQRPGIRVVQLTVTDGNASAQQLYAKCGFVPFGVEPLAIAVGDGFAAKVHMWCKLR